MYLSKPGKKYTYETDYYCMFDGVGGYWCGLWSGSHSIRIASYCLYVFPHCLCLSSYQTIGNQIPK